MVKGGRVVSDYEIRYFLSKLKVESHFKTIIK